MKILITGSEGNIGSELVPYLIKKGHNVLCLDIVQKYRENYILCDVNNLSDADKKIYNFEPQVIIHMAAMVSRITCEKSPSITTLTNLVGTMNVINIAMRYNCRLINFSTSEVYGNQDCFLDEHIEPKPNNFYGLTKLMAEDMVKHFAKTGKFTYVNLRPFMIYSENENFGENRSAMIRFAEDIIRQNKVTVHEGSVRSWLHISDAIVLIEKMMFLNENITLNMGNNDFIYIEEMAKKMMALSERYVVKDNHVEYPLLNIVDLPDKMTLCKRASFDLQLKKLKYTPRVSQEEGILRVLKVVEKRIKNEL
jgi:nucleoside-diphosphate-sugar epimerase